MQARSLARADPRTDGGAPNMTHREVVALGLKFYRTGKPCNQGHLSERYTAGGDCVPCARERLIALAGRPTKDFARNKQPRESWVRNAIGRARESRTT